MYPSDLEVTASSITASLLRTLSLCLSHSPFIMHPPTHCPNVTHSPRAPDSSSPRHTTMARSTSAAGSPQWPSTDSMLSFYQDPVGYIGDIIDQPPMPQDYDSIDNYLNPDISFGSNQSDASSFNAPWYEPPANSLLLAPNVPHDVSSGVYYPFSGNLAPHNNTSNPRHHTIPGIRVNTALSPPSALEHLSTPYNANSTLSASPRSGHSNSPYTPASLSPMRNNTLVVDSAHQSPHSPALNGIQQLRSPAPSLTVKSPYSMAPYSPSASSSISGFEDMSLASAVDPNFPPFTQVTQHASVYDIARLYPDSNRLVPQRTYRPNTQSDRRRYVEEVQLEEPIMFFVSNPDGLGISCRDALNSRFIRLRGRDDQMFINRGPSVSIRVMWPGYAAWSRQIPTRDFRTPPGPITRAKLAKNVAKTVDRFINDMSTKPMEDEADPRWRVGNHHITIDQLELVGLQHVSMGSWQVHLRLRQ